MGTLGRLAGHVVLVTGSTSGLGRAIALRFAADGADVVVTGRDVARGTEVARACERLGTGAAFIPADLCDEGSATAMVGGAVARFDRLTSVVNAAAATDALEADTKVGDLATETWEHVLGVNATGAFWVCRAAVHHLAEAGGGAITNLSSPFGDGSTPGLAAHHVSKAALEALTRSIAADHAADGVRCNALVPGDVLDAAVVDEVTATCTWLATGEAADVTGQVLTVPADPHHLAPGA